MNGTPFAIYTLGCSAPTVLHRMKNAVLGPPVAVKVIGRPLIITQT